jgi:sodium/bile acid cotransporter 7
MESTISAAPQISIDREKTLRSHRRYWVLRRAQDIVFSLLALILVINTYMARWMGFSKPDEITIVFCGSKKSLANGIPMANILFPTSVIGMMVLPLMIFHQIQLMVCAVLARRYKRQTEKLAQEETRAAKA